MAASISSVAEVRATCKGAGHALAGKQHMGDAWIAATALTYGLPLLTGDHGYQDGPGLHLLHEGW